VRFGATLCFFVVLAVRVAWSTAGAAETVENLYRGEAIVTGQDDLEERQRGFREAFAEALIKVTGDAHLPEDPRLQPAFSESGAYVDKFAYEDRLKKKKLMDEQGTRERSYFLRVDFDQVEVDRLLAELGARPWGADRPKVQVLLAIQDTVGPYVLTADSERGYGQREALLSVARRRGVPIVLPAAEWLELISYKQIAAADADAIARAKIANAADEVLLGNMVMTPEGVWNTDWTLLDDHRLRRWRVENTTFDRAIAQGIAGSAGVLAGID
jgi:hypothetical protein